MDAGSAGDVRVVPGIERLHARYAGPLYLFLLRRLGDAEAAEEAVQDTLLRAWRASDRFDPARGSLDSWVFAIARNAATDRLRARAVRPWDDPVRAPEADEVIDDAVVDRALEAWQLAAALARLSPEHRDAIVAVHYLGYPLADAAAELGVPVGTVKSRLSYGLRALRLALEEQGVVG